MNFNSKNGCLKCTINGEYSHTSRTVIFPSLHCTPRTDEKFRKKMYGKHHNGDESPILRICAVDMVKDFIVADPLHLLELGVMKRLLTGWRDGKFGFTGKLSAFQIQKLSDRITKIRLPCEFHRKIRSLDCLAFWKGTEWRTFLNYIGIIVLSDMLDETLYNHFLLLFTAITICSSDFYVNLRPLAQQLFERFIEEFKNIYGEEYITSNIHNLEHVVSDVERFGSLDSISAYPFENYLSQLKKCLRQGNNCLEQVANRILEKITVKQYRETPKGPFPNLFKRNNNINCSIRDGLLLNQSFENSWFLSKQNEIVKMCDASYDDTN